MVESSMRRPHGVCKRNVLRRHRCCEPPSVISKQRSTMVNAREPLRFHKADALSDKVSAVQMDGKGRRYGSWCCIFQPFLRFPERWSGFSIPRSAKLFERSCCYVLKTSEDDLKMPIFEFQCTKCESEFELLVSGQEKPECPECHSKKLEKLMSAAAGRVSSGASLPIAGPSCPPPEAGPCGTGCCRLP